MRARWIKNSKKPVNVAFQGEIGAYSESAIYEFFGSNVYPVPCKRFSDVFKCI
ncbi:MAG: prephenate dehydratase domain-containing protein, partial [Candidatus Bathyarchaeia archaeon]